VQRVEPGKVFYETLDGAEGILDFDFAMLLPPFRGQDLQAFDRGGADISSDLFAPNGFLKVDADYSAKPYEEWKASDWPSTYVSPRYPNLFGVGIAFAPPHPISKPRKSPNGTVISPAPPRTGMPSGIMARQVARSIADMINKGLGEPVHTAGEEDHPAAHVAADTGLPLHGGDLENAQDHRSLARALMRLAKAVVIGDLEVARLPAACSGSMKSRWFTCRCPRSKIWRHRFFTPARAGCG
jgi:hypothetical protein